MPCFGSRLVGTAQEGGAPCRSACRGADTDGNRFSRWALVTAANRLPLMPFAQLATRIGGALTAMAALLSLKARRELRPGQGWKIMEALAYEAGPAMGA
jgi:hypothetical protein